MPAHRKHQFSLAEIGSVYQMTRAGAGLLVKKHGYEVASDPELLFAHLLEKGRACALRTRLSDPDFRQAAAHTLRALAQP